MNFNALLNTPVIRCLTLYLLIMNHELIAQVPKITDFAPQSGIVGTPIIINGLNFGTTPSENVVYFGGARGEVTSATLTQLVVKVPIGATYEPISITTGGKVAYSFQSFIPTFSGGEIAYKPRVDYPVSNSPRFVDAGDFNNDGHLDLMICHTDINRVSIMPGDGTGALQAANHYTIGTGNVSVAADFSGNGLLDLVATNYSPSAPATTSVLLNEGGFNFSAASEYFLSNGPVGIGSGAVYVAENDFNLDGHLDVAFAIDNIPGSISVLLNGGAGSFGTRIEYPVTHYPYSVASGDFNKDGFPDLAVANFFTQTISVLMNDGSGGFLPEATYTSDSGSHDIKVADFNHDGHLDLVVVNAQSNTINIFTNDGSGKFPTRTDYPSGSTYQPSITLSDVNGDGELDIIVGSSGSSIFLLMSNDSGGYDAPKEFAVGNSPFSIAAGDFDEDGKPDLVVGNFADHTISVFLSKPDETEEPPGPNEPPVGDLIVYNALSPDDDGKNDIFFLENIAQRSATNTVAVYNRWGDELWQGVNYDNTTVYFNGLSSNGNKLPTGTYYYKIAFDDGKTKFGFLSIKR